MKWGPKPIYLPAHAYTSIFLALPFVTSWWSTYAFTGDVSRQRCCESNFRWRTPQEQPIARRNFPNNWTGKWRICSVATCSHGCRLGYKVRISLCFSDCSAFTSHNCLRNINTWGKDSISSPFGNVQCLVLYQINSVCCIYLGLRKGHQVARKRCACSTSLIMLFSRHFELSLVFCVKRITCTCTHMYLHTYTCD